MNKFSLLYDSLRAEVLLERMIKLCRQSGDAYCDSPGDIVDEATEVLASIRRVRLAVERDCAGDTEAVEAIRDRVAQDVGFDFRDTDYRESVEHATARQS